MEVNKVMLDSVVTIRKIPMTNRGCDNLRAAQKYFVEGFNKQNGKVNEIPYPTVIHFVLADFVKRHGLENDGNKTLSNSD